MKYTIYYGDSLPNTLNLRPSPLFVSEKVKTTAFRRYYGYYGDSLLNTLKHCLSPPDIGRDKNIYHLSLAIC